MRPLPLLLLLVASACSSTPNPTPSDGAVPLDVPAGDRPAGGDAADVTPQGDGGTADAAADAPATTRCGTDRPDISGIANTEGLMIGPDGTIYYSQPAGVGRMRPGMAQEDGWATLEATATTVWGIALDVPHHQLFVGSPATHKIYAVDMSADAPTGTDFVTSAGSPNGLTTGPDGALWYTDFGAGVVYRVDATGQKTRENSAAIAQANGIAFGPDGSLYVDSYGSGTLLRLTLDANHHEMARSVVAMNLGAIDGLALDAMGRFYVSPNSTGASGPGSLIQLAADGSSRMTLIPSIVAAANIEFGAGSLRCTDIYVASGGALQRYEMGTTPGADVPWHH